MSTEDHNAFEEESEKDFDEYKDILLEINSKFRQQIRSIGVKKNVIPLKYILPKAYISRLLNLREFRRVWERKTIYLLREGKWIQIKTYPNLGGIEVEEGPELAVIVQRIPRRTRSS
jgi:hypothetical protein